jgi:hypothetical protein
VIAAGADKILAFIDANSGKLVRRLEKTVEPVAYLEVSPDGAFVATVFMKADNLVLPAPVAVWETSSGLKTRVVAANGSSRHQLDAGRTPYFCPTPHLIPCGSGGFARRISAAKLLASDPFFTVGLHSLLEIALADDSGRMTGKREVIPR